MCARQASLLSPAVPAARRVLMPRGFCRTATGFRAWVRVTSKHDGFNALDTKRFAATATVADIQAWRTETRTRLQQRLETRRQRRALIHGQPGTFTADAENYLAAVRAMPTFRQRAKDIALWIDEFGDRGRRTIQSHEIRAVRDRWLTVGPRRRWQKVNGVGQWLDVAEPLAASSVNHRLRALSNLWTVLDGRHAQNPIREVPEAIEPRAVPRAIDYATIRQILDAMSDQGFPQRAQKRPDHSLAKVRARVLAWTGMTPSELAALRPSDINWTDAVLAAPPRRKGRGAPGRVLPLSQDALDALRDFDRLNAYGRFTERAVLRAWQLAAVAVLGRRVRLYDLRHSFITAVVRETRSLSTAQLLAGHTDPRTTQRYALAAILPTLRAGIDATFPSDKKESQ